MFSAYPSLQFDDGKSSHCNKNCFKCVPKATALIQLVKMHNIGLCV